MIAVVSPSKDLNYKSEIPFKSNDLPRLFGQTMQILEVIRKKKVKELMKLMDISTKLAEENVKRYQNFSDVFTPLNSRQAIFAFDGDVYKGLDAYSLQKSQLDYCQNHLRILSGLYGLLKPFDLMQAYRLEMGVPLKVNRKKNLYEYWGTSITDLLKEDIEQTQSKHLINLASQEYFGVLQPERIGVPIINIHFREFKKNGLTFVSYTAKKVRGLMVKYMALEKLQTAEGLKNFNLDNYHFQPDMSSINDWFFIR
jgi:cytoplasmic iron level regulating protein YaaA (DUF328/UPF0246 family)